MGFSSRKFLAACQFHFYGLTMGQSEIAKLVRGLGGPVELKIVLVTSTEDRAAGLNIGEIVGGQCSLLLIVVSIFVSDDDVFWNFQFSGERSHEFNHHQFFFSASWKYLQRAFVEFT